MKKLHTINLVTNFKTKKITPGPFGNGTSNFNILFLFEIEIVFRVVWVEGTKSLKYLFKKVFFWKYVPLRDFVICLRKKRFTSPGYLRHAPWHTPNWTEAFDGSHASRGKFFDKVFWTTTVDKIFVTSSSFHVK